MKKKQSGGATACSPRVKPRGWRAAAAGAGGRHAAREGDGGARGRPPGRTAARKRRRACAAAACPARGGATARGDGVHGNFRQHLPCVGCSALRLRLDGNGEGQGGARVNIYHRPFSRGPYYEPRLKTTFSRGPLYHPRLKAIFGSCRNLRARRPFSRGWYHYPRLISVLKIF